MDRRKRKSLEAMQHALLTLVREKDFELITVADIAEKADLNRGTFYLHYESKYSMVDELEKEFVAKLQYVISQAFKETTPFDALILSRYNALIYFFDTFKDHRDTLEIILKTKGSISLQTHLNIIMEQLLKEQNFLKDQIAKSIPIELFQSLIVSICLGIVQYSMENENKHTSEELTQGLLNVIVNGPARAAGLIKDGFIEIDNLISTSKQ